MKRLSIKSLLIMIVLVFGHAMAQGFSVGSSLDSPGLLEVRVGYEAQDFGVWAYLTYVGLWVLMLMPEWLAIQTQRLGLGLGWWSFGIFRRLGFAV